MIIMTTDLWRMSATELAAAIKSRKISSQEVIEAHLRRIEAVNPSVNAGTVTLGEQALEATTDDSCRNRGRQSSKTSVAYQKL